MPNRFIRLRLVLAMLTLGTFPIDADEILSLAAPPTLSGTNYQWSYNATVSGTLQTGDYITLYDVAGYVPGSESGGSSSFTPVVQMNGLTPPGVTATDSAVIPNITWEYNGPTVTMAPGTSATYAFSFQSIIGTAHQGSFSFLNAAGNVKGVASVATPSLTSSTTYPASSQFTVAADSAAVSSGGEYLNTYHINKGNGSFGPGSEFTIYDVKGYVPGSVQAPVGWTTSYQLVGPTPSNLNPLDSNAIINLTFSYTGAVNSSTAAIIDGFSFLTTSPDSTTGEYYTSDVFGLGSTAPGSEDQLIGVLGVTSLPTAAPEPSPAGLLALALFLGLIALRRPRLRKKLVTSVVYFVAPN